MKNIKIKCILCTNINATKFSIIIKDNKDNILLNTKTNTDGTINFNFEINKVYKIIVMSKQFVVYIKEHMKDTILLYLGNPIPKCNKNISITFKIIDLYYENLPITEGNIYVKRNTNSHN